LINFVVSLQKNRTNAENEALSSFSVLMVLQE